MLLSSLLHLYLFGRTYKKIRCNIVKETKRSVIVHIASQARAKEILSIGGLCAGEVQVKDIIHSCCAKVNVVLINNGGRSILGYVLDEKRGRWEIQLTNNCIICSRAPTFDSSLFTYSFPRIQKSRGIEFSISQYWPIRLMILRRGEIKFTLNRVAFNTFGNELVLQQCS